MVAILLPRNSEQLYISQLAVLKAGAAYACIDPALPGEQIRYILEDSQAVAVLTDGPGLIRARRAEPEVVCFLDVCEWLDAFEEPVERLSPPAWLTPNSLAYLIYTSGHDRSAQGGDDRARQHRQSRSRRSPEFCGRPGGPRGAEFPRVAYDNSVEEDLARVCRRSGARRDGRRDQPAGPRSGSLDAAGTDHACYARRRLRCGRWVATIPRRSCPTFASFTSAVNRCRSDWRDRWAAGRSFGQRLRPDRMRRHRDAEAKSSPAARSRSAPPSPTCKPGFSTNISKKSPTANRGTLPRRRRAGAAT